MKYSIYLILFLIFSILIFQINNYLILFSFLIFNIFITMLLKINIKLEISNLLLFLPFIIFTILVNLLFTSIEMSMLIGFRLLIVSNATYIISFILTPIVLAKAISNLLYPLKIFKINCKDISLIITIALSFIPILTDEMKQIKYSLISKNFNFNLKNIFTRPHIFMITYMNGIFDRIDTVEKSLNSKAYD